MASHHFSQFSGYTPCGSNDTAAKTLYVTLQDHMIKGTGDFMKVKSSLHIPTLEKLIALDIVLMNI